MNKRLALIVLGILSVAGTCQEPPKTGMMEEAIKGLADIHAWDASNEAAGQLSYDFCMSHAPEIQPQLVAHIIDETPTGLYDKTFDITVMVGDICFYMLLRQLRLDWKVFFDDGVFVTTLLPNPIFCIRWKDPSLASRRRVQARMAQLLPKPEDQ